MRFFIDTANLDVIQKHICYDFCSGITTNPSLASKEGDHSYKNLISSLVELCKKYSKPISIEVFTNDKDKIYDAAMEIMDYYEYEKIYVKVPIGFENIKIIERLRKKNILINCTCVFSLSQALLCIKSDVNFISIFYNRIKDMNQDPNKIIRITKDVIVKNKSNSEILVGSVRKVEDIESAAEYGAHIATIPPKLFEQSCFHVGSVKAIDQFLEDAKKIKL